MQATLPASVDQCLARCRVVDGGGFTLDRHDPHGPVPDGLDKELAEQLMADGIARLSDLQERLYEAEP